MIQQYYVSPDSKVIRVANPAGICQGSPLDLYTGTDLGDDFEEDE